MTVGAMTATGSGTIIIMANLADNIGSANSKIMNSVRIFGTTTASYNRRSMSAFMHGVRITATSREVMAASRAGITRINRRKASTTSTPRNGMANARAATLHGSGMTAMERGGRETALAKLMAGGSGISGAKVTTLVATRAKVTTGSLKPIIR